MKLVEIKLYLISYIGKLGFEDTVFKDCRLKKKRKKKKERKKKERKKKERKWIILKFPWSSTCAQSAEE